MGERAWWEIHGFVSQLLNKCVHLRVKVRVKREFDNLYSMFVLLV